MFVTDKLIYIQLHKTASTHISRLLKEVIGGNQLKKHSLASLESKHNFVLGSIRNPWDWYVSLWSYGCRNKGSLQQRLIHRTHFLYRLRCWKASPIQNFEHFVKGLISSVFRPRNKWRQVYADATNPLLFQSWLKMLLLNSA